MASDVPTFQRTDGVSLSATQIDARLKELMSAADVGGLGLALINDGQIACHEDMDQPVWTAACRWKGKNEDTHVLFR